VETQAIADVLGGRKVLGSRMKKPDDLAHMVRNGLPAGAVLELAQRLNIGNVTLARILGIPLRTLTRRLSAGAALTPSESDRIVRMARVYAAAIEFIGDEENAVGWMRTPNRGLGGEKPLDLLDTDTGARMVEDVLGHIAYGIYC
jgi:putative toxin-antitoxin system antitoxin component (TIGR02293 family)